MYNYNVIRKAIKEWAQYKKVKLSEKDLTILAFYAQEHYKSENNGKTLFNNYIEKEVEFDWDMVSDETSEFIVKLWNTYKYAAQQGNLELMVVWEENYNDIKEIIK